MCKKCTRHHHTLLHRDDDNSTQKKPENAEAKGEAHVAALSISEQVLLMTCKVKVTAPNGSSTIARALIDPGSSTSFVYEQIAQLLRLPLRKKNVMVDGVGGTTMPTRGSVWLQVCVCVAGVRTRAFNVFASSIFNVFASSAKRAHVRLRTSTKCVRR